MSVEVERKFLFSDDTLKTLESIGVCVGEHQFHDQYYDTPESELTLRDMWLRKRKGCWELKCPTSTSSSGREELSGEQSVAAVLCTCYKEINNLPEIYQRVREVLKEAGKDGELEETPSQGDDSWLSRLNLACFAEYTTTRRSFTLREGGVQIDLDQADFGHHVGELEVLVPEGGDVQSAQEKITETALKLGLTGDKQVEGKMNVFLKRYRPEQYEKLLRAHVL
uniref:Thiamine triphosphatase n=1 Tax=Nothobranchius kadleci TaxID=1051664 RepID=A0A1A8E530_NOTKA